MVPNSIFCNLKLSLSDSCLYYEPPNHTGYPYHLYDFLKVSVGICLCGHVPYYHIRIAPQTYSTLFQQVHRKIRPFIPPIQSGAVACTAEVVLVRTKVSPACQAPPHVNYTTTV